MSTTSTTPTSSLMDFFSGLTAATSAGKYPSTKQANAMADWLLKSPLLQLEQAAAGTGGKLSENGQVVLQDLREIVSAYQAAAMSKNGDDVLQDALYALNEASVNADATKGEAAKDAGDVVGAVKLLFDVLLGRVAKGDELASMARLTVADVAEVIEAQAGAAKENLRKIGRAHV